MEDIVKRVSDMLNLLKSIQHNQEVIKKQMEEWKVSVEKLKPINNLPKEKRISEKIEELLNSMTPEELQKLWEQLEPFNHTGPLAEDFCNEMEKYFIYHKKSNKNVY